MFAQPTATSVTLPQLLRKPWKGQIMTKHKAIALAGLVLAFAIPGPTSAVADPACPASPPVGAERSCRPLKIGGTGTVRLNTQTLQFTVEGSGLGTHTGKGLVRLANGQAQPIGFTPPNLVRLALEADVTVVAADGDKLYGHLAMTTEPFALGSAHTDEGQLTITGGSGRFEGAHGELDQTTDVSPGTFVQQNGVTWMISQMEFTSEGYVIY
jgi:hypothetical protein